MSKQSFRYLLDLVVGIFVFTFLIFFSNMCKVFDELHHYSPENPSPWYVLILQILSLVFILIIPLVLRDQALKSWIEKS